MFEREIAYIFYSAMMIMICVVIVVAFVKCAYLFLKRNK